MIFRRFGSIPILRLLTIMAVATLLMQVASSSAQQQAAVGQAQIKALSLPHLYWHFLVHVSFLDKSADEMSAQGRDGTWLRNDLQTRLQFSDADFAPIRVSSQRLASELTTLNQQINSLQSPSPSASKVAQIKALSAQRETYINAEIMVLTQTLSPQKRAALEAFMTQFFAPKTLSPLRSATPAHQ